MKTIALLNLINHEPDIAKTFTYAKDPYKAKYQLLINKKESKGLKQLNDSKVFIQYWNDMDDICKIIEYHNTNKKQKVMIVFDDMVADIFSNKEPNPTVTELFIRGRKLNISVVFVRQVYFGVPKNIRLNSTHIFVMTIPSKRKIHQILTFKTLWGLVKSALQNLILFLLLIQLLHQIIPHISEIIFKKNIKTNHDNWWYN